MPSSLVLDVPRAYNVISAARRSVLGRRPDDRADWHATCVGKLGSISARAPWNSRTLKRSLVLVPPLAHRFAVLRKRRRRRHPQPPASSAAVKPDCTLSPATPAPSRDYRYRGISQTRQDARPPGRRRHRAQAAGFYAGDLELRTIERIEDGGGDANLEVDVLRRLQARRPAPVTLDVRRAALPATRAPATGRERLRGRQHRALRRRRPGARPALKVPARRHRPSSAFNDSKNSWYLEGNGSFEIGNGFSVIGHLGYQKLRNNARVVEIGATSPQDSITDWKIGVTYDLSGFLLGAAYVGTNRDLTGGTAALSNRNISSDTVVLSVSKSF